MQIEDIRTYLAGPGVKGMLERALEIAKIPKSAYKKDRHNILTILHEKGLVLRPAFSLRMPLESRAGWITYHLSHALPNQSIIIPHDSGVLANPPWRHIKRSRLLLTKPLGKLDKSGVRMDKSWLPYPQVKTLLPHVGLSDRIVGYRFQGNQGIENHVVWLIDWIRARYVHTNLDKGSVGVAGNYYGVSDSVALPELEGIADRRCFRVVQVPSLGKPESYDLLIHNVPVYETVPHHEVIQAAFNIETRHSCKKDEYYNTKSKRQTLSIKPENGERYPSSTTSGEKLMCHHLIMAMYAIEDAVIARGGKMLELFPRQTPLLDRLDPLYFKCVNNGLKERKLKDGKMVLETLGDIDIETLLWYEIGRQNDTEKGILYPAFTR